MKRNFKALGLALVVALAICAVAASAAQALDGHFKAAELPAVATGEQEGLTANNFFQITPKGASASVHCSIAKYEATIEVETTVITVTPHYTTCESTAALNVAASVDLNGCHFQFELGEYTSVPNDAHNTQVHIICPVGQQIEVTSGGLCTTDVPPQTIKTTGSEVTYTNLVEGTTKYVTVHVDITEKIRYKETKKPSPFCPFAEGHETTDGNFVSTVRFDCFKDSAKKAVTTEDPDGTKWNKNEYTHPVGKISCDVGI